MNARTAARFTEEPDFDLTQMHLILRAVLSQTTSVVPKCPTA
jgi:hypothetical protein